MLLSEPEGVRALRSSPVLCPSGGFQSPAGESPDPGLQAVDQPVWFATAGSENCLPGRASPFFILHVLGDIGSRNEQKADSTMSDFHRTILIPANETETTAFNDVISGAGHSLLHVPLQACGEPENWQAADEALDAIEVYHGIILPNPNAANGLLHRLRQRGISSGSLPTVYAVGPRTASTLAAEGIESVPVPENASPSDLDAIVGEVSNQFVLFAGTAQPSRAFTGYIAERGGKMNNIAVYRLASLPHQRIVALDQKLIEGDVDCVAFFSPQMARSFTTVIPEFKQATILIAGIDQQTAAAVAGNGLRIDVISPQPDQRSFARCIADHFNSDMRIDLDPDLHMDYS